MSLFQNGIWLYMEAMVEIHKRAGLLEMSLIQHGRLLVLGYSLPENRYGPHLQSVCLPFGQVLPCHCLVTTVCDSVHRIFRSLISVHDAPVMTQVRLLQQQLQRESQQEQTFCKQITYAAP